MQYLFFLNQFKKIKITKKKIKNNPPKKPKTILPPKQKNPKIQNKKQNKQKKSTIFGTKELKAEI